jgi:hypothetical protein
MKERNQLSEAGFSGFSGLLAQEILWCFRIITIQTKKDNEHNKLQNPVNLKNSENPASE